MKRLTSENIERCLIYNVVNKNIMGKGYFEDSCFFINLIIKMKFI